VEVYGHMKKYLDPDWLRKEYHEKHRTLQSIGDECGVSRQAVHDAARRFGIEYVPVPKRIDIAWLREQREVERRTMPDIANALGVSRMVISRLCHKHKIQRPKRSEEYRAAQSLACENHRYATDPAYREMKKRCTARWRKTHRAQYLKYQREYAARRRNGET
jgi:hypothetical protein